MKFDKPKKNHVIIMHSYIESVFILGIIKCTVINNLANSYIRMLYQ